MRLHTVKFLEGNIGRPLSDINRGKIFFNVPSRIMEIKTKINKLDLLKLKRFCTVLASAAHILKLERYRED